MTKFLYTCWIFLLLSSCSCSDLCLEWRDESAIGTSSSFNSARMYLPPSNEYSGLELELVAMRDGLRFYINVFGLEIPPETSNPATSRVFISFRDHSYHFSAARFLGGQRLLIPDYVVSEMIDYLQEDQPIFIQVGRYQANIYPDKFNEAFYKIAAMQL